MNNSNIKRRIKLAGAIMAAAVAVAPGFCPDAVAQECATPARFSPLASGYLERARVMASASNYGGVIDQISMLQAAGTNLTPAEVEEAVYLLAQAYYQRGDSRCLSLLQAFSNDYPASIRSLAVQLSTADFYFFAHDFAKALALYDEIDYSALNRTEWPLYTYRMALCMVKTGHYDEALTLLDRIEGENGYETAVDFYKAYIDYVRGETDKAYNTFASIASSSGRGAKRGDSDLALESRCYMTQIEYERKEYDLVIDEGTQLLQSIRDTELVPEMQRVVGMSYFKRDNYQQARAYLDRYADAVDEVSDESLYALGVIDYTDGQYEEALQKFDRLTSLNNDMAQSAWLYIGQSNVKLGDDSAAILAFEKAAKMNFDRNVTENALYNYAAAVTRGNSVPFSSSSALLEQFVSNFPNSEFAPKVEEYLATAYYNDRNYSRALASINRIRKPSAAVLSAKQKILYELGMESMNSGKASVAADYLRQAVELSSQDRDIAAQANLWLGDAYYSLGEFKKAAAAYRSYLSSRQRDNNRALALYNLAYADYMLEDYSGAASDFKQALSATPALPQAMKNDARIRMADCLYYTGNYRQALTNYTEAINAGADDSDYATFRRAVMYGLGGDVNKKISELNAMDSRYPSSRWLSTAMMEKAQTYGALDRTAEAAKTFSELASKYPNTNEARRATLSMALEYMKSGERAKAVEAYKEVIRSWPSSQEAATANEDLRKYYASIGDLPAYALFLQSVPGAKQLNVDEMEDLAFDAAENAYADDANAISLLQTYVQQYPDGRHLAPALLDIASSLNAQKKYAEAVEAADRLISSRKYSPQYPEALLLKAEILETKMPARRGEALEAYRLLEASGDNDFLVDAYSGIMRTAAEPSVRAEYARKARLSGGLSAEAVEEATYYEAEALMEAGKTAEAVSMFGTLAENPKSLAGAKAAVTLGQYYIDTKNYGQAEKVLSDFTDAGTPHEYWLARGFIALADVYHAQGKKSLAKEYLTSLRDNYPGSGDDIPSLISKRLKQWK